LDSKFIALGYVRKELVDELCYKATMQLVREGQRFANNQLNGQNGLVSNITTMVSQRCAGLIDEAETACNGVIGMVVRRAEEAEKELEIEGEKQCESTKEQTVAMVKLGVERSFNESAQLGRRLAETEFNRQVEQQKNKGERKFHEEVEKNRGLAEKELRDKVAEGRVTAEETLKREVEKGKVEAERVYQETIEREREKAEKILTDTVTEKRAEAEVVFAERVAAGREEAEKLYRERAREGELEGERLCTEMITVACQNSTPFTNSEDFCLDFLFFTSDLDERKKREHSHLYGSFYEKVKHNE